MYEVSTSCCICWVWWWYYGCECFDWYENNV